MLKILEIITRGIIVYGARFIAYILIPIIYYDGLYSHYVIELDIVTFILISYVSMRYWKWLKDGSGINYILKVMAKNIRKVYVKLGYIPKKRDFSKKR